jgi:hypothetical protein
LGWLWALGQWAGSSLVAGSGPRACHVCGKALLQAFRGRPPTPSSPLPTPLPSELTRWLAKKAEELGVEIYPGFAGGGGGGR